MLLQGSRDCNIYNGQNSQSRTGHHFAIQHSLKRFRMIVLNVDWSHIYPEQGSYSRAVWSAWGYVCVEVSEGLCRPENQGNSVGLGCAGLLPGYLLGGSDCLDWWFRMFTGSEGTIIHRGRGQLWIAFLPALLSLPMTPGPPPLPLNHITHFRDPWFHWPSW